MRLIAEGGRPEVPAEIQEHPWLEQLLKQCWNQDPALRPSAAQIKETLSVSRSFELFDTPMHSLTLIFWILKAHIKQAQPAPRTGFFSYLMSWFWGS